MEDKQILLQNIQQLSSQGLITKEELLASFTLGQGDPKGTAVDPGFFHRLSIAELMYYIGGFIVVLGIVILLAQNWESLSVLARVLVTFGSSVIALVVGVLFSRDQRTKMLDQPFYLISSLVLPVGIYQLFALFGFEVQDVWDFTLIFALSTAWYLAAYGVLRRIVFLLFGILAGTVLYFAFIQAAFVNKLMYEVIEIYEYEVLVIGVCYILLGYGFAKFKSIKLLTPMLYAFGAIAVLGSTFALQGWIPEQNILWELAYPFLALGAMFASTSINQRSWLILGALSLMAYLIKITSEYFSEGFGWPLALVMCGFAFIGIGYFTYYINKKYFSNPASLDRAPKLE